MQMPVANPRMPRAAERSVWKILVHDITVARQNARAEFEKALRRAPIARTRERKGDVCGITRPYVRVRIESVLQHVGITRCQNPSALINVRAGVHKTPAEKCRMLLPEIQKIALGFLPEP